MPKLPVVGGFALDQTELWAAWNSDGNDGAALQTAFDRFGGNPRNLPAVEEKVGCVTVKGGQGR